METFDARRMAFHSLLKCYNDRKYSNIELDGTLKKCSPDPRERALYTALVYGVIERRYTLDYIICRLSQRPADKIEPAVMTALELGLYQIMYLDRVPDSAACNETVETVKKVSGLGAGNFANALLRRAVRQKDSLKGIINGLDGNNLNIKYSVEPWIADCLINSVGQKGALDTLEAFFCRAPMTLRANTLRTNRQQLADKLAQAGIQSEPCDFAPHGLRLTQATSLDKLKPFEGLFFVQDEASQLAIAKLDLAPGQTVVDCCACPGGKSFAAALETEGKGSIISLDLHQNKLSLIQKSAQALGIDIIRTDVHDGTSPLESLKGKADRVICDVPCSGLGVIHKKPDIRYKRQDEVQKLPEIQQKILYSAAQYLKPGGKLLYSTCTLNGMENGSITDGFLITYPDFERKENLTLLPKTRDGRVLNDGFYIDIIERKG